MDARPDSPDVHYNHLPAGKATFKAGLDSIVHRWFRLTPSFGPDLVRAMLEDLHYQPGEHVLDPFAGAGTTIIECQLQAIPSVGFEINPFLHFIGNTSLNWRLSVSELRVQLKQIQQDYEALDARIASIEDIGSFGLKLPPIHNPARWWRPDILKQLLVLKHAINTTAQSQDMQDFFLLALAAVLVPDLTNVTLGRLQLHFIDRDHDEIQVFPTFKAHVERMIHDIALLHSHGLARTSHILLADALTPRQEEIGAAIDCIITSPPYPNRYSYVWNTRPYLYLLGFFDTPGEASSLDMKTIGGTWGTATSVLSKDKIEPAYPIIAEVISPLVETIRVDDNLMANYAMKYFNMLAAQIVAMDALLAPNARAAYVVGCSRLKGVYIETDLLLAKIFEGLGLGYTISRVERIRKRHSGKDLHESIVFSEKR